MTGGRRRWTVGKEKGQGGSRGAVDTQRPLNVAHSHTGQRARDNEMHYSKIGNND